MLNEYEHVVSKYMLSQRRAKKILHLGLKHVLKCAIKNWNRGTGKQMISTDRSIASLNLEMENKGEDLKMIEVNYKYETRDMLQMLFVSKVCLIFI